MNELSLFSGAGGGLLGTKLLGWKHIGYVENNKYCQKIIAQRIKDGILNEAPIFGDIRAFIDQGYSWLYRGVTDVITAGFPCQPFSVAGKRLAGQDDRNMWPETAHVIREVRPSLILLENVPGLLSNEYAIEIFYNLYEIGYQTLPPIMFGADDIGANHKRKRIWIMAYSDNSGWEKQWRTESIQKGHNTTQCISQNIPNTKKQYDRKYNSEQSKRQIQQLRKCVGKTDVSNTKSKRKMSKEQQGQWNIIKQSSKDMAYTQSEQTGRILKPEFSENIGTRSNATRQAAWWAVEPDMGRVANGVASRVDRLKALGNGQVPAVVATIWRLINYLEQL